MKNISTCLLFIFCAHVFAHDQAEDYRFNPFQFKLPEYRFKADVKHIISTTQTPDSYKSVQFQSYRFLIPKTFTTRDEDLRTLSVRDGNGKGMFLMTLERPDLLLCGKAKNEKDYCSVFDDRRDLLTKTFTLTPEDLTKQEYRDRGYSWIVFYKGVHFQYVSEIKMYASDGFFFFRQDLKSSAPMKDIKVNVKISSPKDDQLLDITFLVKDEELIMDFIKSFQLIKP